MPGLTFAPLLLYKGAATCVAVGVAGEEDTVAIMACVALVQSHDLFAH